MSNRVCAVSCGRTLDGERCLACRGCGGWVENEAAMEKECFDYSWVCRKITRYADPDQEPP